MDYATLDQEKIIQYVRDHGGYCKVDDLIDNSGAEPLRIYPMIYRLKQANRITITEYDPLGAPTEIGINDY